MKFTFEIDGIQTGEVDGKKFYKVSSTRNLSGTSADGDAVNNNSPRYIEVNYDPRNPGPQDREHVHQGLRRKAGRWSIGGTRMSYEWQSVFRKLTNKTDSVWTVRYPADVIHYRDQSCQQSIHSEHRTTWKVNEPTEAQHQWNDYQRSHTNQKSYRAAGSRLIKVRALPTSQYLSMPIR